jgi:hypothetical protein
MAPPSVRAVAMVGKGIAAERLRGLRPVLERCGRGVNGGALSRGTIRGVINE